jgi:hypothetical protein
VDNQSERRQGRREEIGERLAEIRARIDDLQRAQRESRHPAACGEQLAEAQHHAAFSKATAHQALASSIEAFLRAAGAHDRSAIQHDLAAAAGGRNEEQHRQQSAHHRAAAAADRQRAETARLLLSSRAGNGQEDEPPGDSTASLAPPAGIRLKDGPAEMQEQPLAVPGRWRG